MANKVGFFFTELVLLLGMMIKQDNFVVATVSVSSSVELWSGDPVPQVRLGQPPVDALAWVVAVSADKEVSMDQTLVLVLL